MRILSRHVLQEFLPPLAYCLTGFVSIYVLFDLFGSFARMMDSKISVADAALYFCGYLAPFFHYLVPAALMLATLYTMWTMCRHSEIVAMRASGVSFLAIARPVVTVAFLMAALVAFVNEWFVPRYAQWAVQMKNERFNREKIAKADNIVYRNTRHHRTWNVDRLLASDGSSLGGVRVTLDRPGGARLATVTADRADCLDGEWWFSAPHVQHYDDAGREIATPTPELDSLPLRCFGEFRERPADFMMQNRPWRFNSTRDRFRYIRTHPDLTEKRRDDLAYDAWAQLVSPFACVIITLFAIPAGIASGRQSIFRGVLGALGMFFAFYGVTIGCMAVAKAGLCPPVPCAIFPDLLFLALGVRAFLKHR